MAREKVQLQELGISDTRIRKDAGGGIIVEIPGREGHEKADTLANTLTTALRGVAVISRPVRKGELRITGLDASVTPDDVIRAIIDGEFGSCRPVNVSAGSKKVETTWRQCGSAAPLEWLKK